MRSCSFFKSGLGEVVGDLPGCWVVVDRAVLRPVVDRLTVVWPAVQLPIQDGGNSDGHEDESDVEEEASVHSYEDRAEHALPAHPVRSSQVDDYNETTPLLQDPSSATALDSKSRLPGFNNTFLPGLVALFIAFTPPLKNNLADPSGWVWKVLGGTVGWIGWSYVAVDVLATGVTIRQAEIDKK
jgi:hypothetical protein